MLLGCPVGDFVAGEWPYGNDWIPEPYSLAYALVGHMFLWDWRCGGCYLYFMVVADGCCNPLFHALILLSSSCCIVVLYSLRALCPLIIVVRQTVGLFSVCGLDCLACGGFKWAENVLSLLHFTFIGFCQSLFPFCIISPTRTHTTLFSLEINPHFR